MRIWGNKDLVVFHGTDSISSGATAAATGTTLPFAVNLALCKPNTDFGQGFYVTTNLHQAKQWANTRILKLPTKPGLFAVVLRFQINRNVLATLDTLAFVRPTADFWDFVKDCRLGVPPHQHPLLPPRPRPAYDIVYGPVTLWHQTLTIANCDQISFHTKRAIGKLPRPTLHMRANKRYPLKTLF